MKNPLKFLLRVLDGSPQPIGHFQQKGQSLVEMTLIVPILLLMFVGLVEIGWYANHYLIMLEVTRLGARSGTGLSGTFTPLYWENNPDLLPASLHPVVYQTALGQTIPTQAVNARDCGFSTTRGFYNLIVCNMLQTLRPLTLAGRDPTTTTVVTKTTTDRYGNVTGTIPYPDDIVVSVFALQAVNNADPTSVVIPPQTGTNADPRGFQLASAFFSRTYDFGTSAPYPPGPSVIVVGRYPSNANECNLYRAPNGNITVNPLQRDPFDYIPSSWVSPQTAAYTQDQLLIEGVLRDIELAGYDANTNRESQLGFVWTGQKMRTDIPPVGGNQALCWGSDFDDEEIQDLMNVPNFVQNSGGVRPWETQMAALPSQGLVVAEIYWQHNILLRFPFTEPIVAMFGDVNNIIISTWAAFPVPSVEPNIVYRLP
jgi:hypothetical protein